MLMEWANGNYIIDNLVFVPFLNRELDVKTNLHRSLSLIFIGNSILKPMSYLKKLFDYRKGPFSVKDFKYGELQHETISSLILNSSEEFCFAL